MQLFILSVLLCGFMIGSSISWPWHRYVPQTDDSYITQSTHDYDYDDIYEGAKDFIPHDYGHQNGYYDQNGCACHYYVGSTLVFQRQNTSIWHSCTGHGLYNCYQYCNEMLKDENMQFRIKQDSCDVLGTEIHTMWYRRHQVCGPYGPYEDILLEDTLCCKRGRPADNC